MISVQTSLDLASLFGHLTIGSRRLGSCQASSILKPADPNIDRDLFAISERRPC